MVAVHRKCRKWSVDGSYAPSFLIFSQTKADIGYSSRKDFFASFVAAQGPSASRPSGARTMGGPVRVPIFELFGFGSSPALLRAEGTATADPALAAMV